MSGCRWSESRSLVGSDWPYQRRSEQDGSRLGKETGTSAGRDSGGTPGLSHWEWDSRCVSRGHWTRRLEPVFRMAPLSGKPRPSLTRPRIRSCKSRLISELRSWHRHRDPYAVVYRYETLPPRTFRRDPAPHLDSTSGLRLLGDRGIRAGMGFVDHFARGPGVDLGGPG